MKEYQKDNKLRLLDFDDLIILRNLLIGKNTREIAKILCITQPAISMRITKMSFVFGEKIIKMSHRFRYLTQTGIEAAIKADILLDIMESKSV